MAFGIPSPAGLSATIAAELSKCLGHVVPPQDADPIMWAAFFGWDGGAVNYSDWGVQWSPKSCSAAGGPANAFRVSTDSPPPGEPLPGGKRAIVYPEAFAFRSDQSGTEVWKPQFDLRWSFAVNRTDVPGYSRTFFSGEAVGAYVDGSNITRGLYGTGSVSMRPVAPVRLRAGDQCTFHIREASGLPAGSDSFVLLAVRGWMMPA